MLTSSSSHLTINENQPLLLSVMNTAVNSLFSSTSFRIKSPRHFPRHGNHLLVVPAISCSIRRHNRRRRNFGNRIFSDSSTPPSDDKLQMVFDIDTLSSKAPDSVKTFLSSAELRLNEFMISGDEAFKDLQTLVSVDANQKVVVSCKRSTAVYVGKLVIMGLFVVFSCNVLVRLGLGLRNKLDFSNNGDVVRRRDRSLGGREVVVSTKQQVRVPVNPLSLDLRNQVGVSRQKNRRKVEKLPNWWPESLQPPIATDNNNQYQLMANRLIRAIMDYRVEGKDIMVDDIMQLRRICRASGVKVSIEPTNARDSLFRAAVNYILNICVSQSGNVDFAGESAREFVAGLADNIGLDNIRAARIVAAAVAARTRSCLLQAWALEMQGKHSDGLAELSQLSLIHQIFPPEEFSPEMEMVAQGLEKKLKLEQREHLNKMLAAVCSEESYRSAAEALGLLVGSHRQEDELT